MPPHLNQVAGGSKRASIGGGHQHRTPNPVADGGRDEVVLDELGCSSEGAGMQTEVATGLTKHGAFRWLSRK